MAMEEPTLTFEQRFLHERDELMVARLRLALTMGLAIYASFWVLDAALHPTFALTFGFVRLAVIVMCAAVLALIHRDFGRRHIHVLSVSILSVVACSLSLMTVPLGGFESDYFMGIMLALFFVGMMMPWPTRTTIVACLLMVLPYFALNLMVRGPSWAMASPAAFLTGTAVLTVFASAMFHNLREQDLRTRSKLELANDDLKQLDEAKTRFFANVSHELRTPLMLISGPVDELRATMGGSAPPLLDSIAVNAERLTRHVNMILDFAKIESGRLQPSLGTFNLGFLLDELVYAARPYASQFSLTLESEGLTDLPTTRFDREQIETTAANLISNAVKFTPNGGKIVIRAGHSEDTVWFEVEDDGPGIAPGEIERIFDRFYQVENGAAGKSKGTGLGLALCRELVKLHAGTLTVRSRPGQGACFRATLAKQPPERIDRRLRGRRREDRMARAKLDTLISDSYEERAGIQALFADLKSLETHSAAVASVAPDDAPVLLVVEDDPELRAYLVRNLATEYQIDVAADGVAGLEAARRRTPTLIVSDIMMPRMTGTRMVELMAEDVALMHIPVIMLTARAGEEAVVEGLSLGAVDYVIKPFKMVELRARIAAHIRARQVEKQLDERETRLAAIGQMTGHIAHDLKGPLTAIVGHTELARELAASSADAAILVEDLNAVERAASRAVSMIEEVVDYVREGSLPAQAEPTALGDFVESIAVDLRATLEQLGIRLHVVAPHAPGPVQRVDRIRMRRVVENLVGNAREAITEHEYILPGTFRNIWISTEQVGHTVVLRVADDGPGIPEDMLGRLFTPFFTAGKSKGTGLGLSIVRNLVAIHGGTVVAEEDPPEGGAAFRIELPTPEDP